MKLKSSAGAKAVWGKQSGKEWNRLKMKLKIARVRPGCFSLVWGQRWGIVEWNGDEWLARMAFYQKRASIGGVIKKPMAERRPRYRTVGFYPRYAKAARALAERLKTT